jgi:hypothetical protein
MLRVGVYIDDQRTFDRTGKFKVQCTRGVDQGTYCDVPMLS